MRGIFYISTLQQKHTLPQPSRGELPPPCHSPQRHATVVVGRARRRPT